MYNGLHLCYKLAICLPWICSGCPLKEHGQSAAIVIALNRNLQRITVEFVEVPSVTCDKYCIYACPNSLSTYITGCADVCSVCHYLQTFIGCACVQLVQYMDKHVSISVNILD